MALSPDAMSLRQGKIYYFTGKVRAFWKDKIFFLDQRNAAIVCIENLYLNGIQASQADLHHMDAVVASMDWESAPTFHSYVSKFSSSEVPPWPYKLKGKKLWLAHCAWTGTMPDEVEEAIQGMNVVHFPLTYYTGKLMRVFDDKVLFGDGRNSVMVHTSDLYLFGQRADYSDGWTNFDHQVPIIHSFVSKLSYLTDKGYDGPEPHLPTWPIGEYGSSTWVARFGWQGEMPEELRQQLSLFQIVKITDWDNNAKLPGGNIPLSLKSIKSSSHNFATLAKGKNTAKSGPAPLIATTQKEASIVKGGLMLADHKFGLMNSYFDVIVFSTKNFYVHGELFREGMSLCEFFHERKATLTAWIVPLPEPVLVFDVYVMWRAVCVWYGVPPKNMEGIKKRYDNGTIAGTVPEGLNTATDNRYTLVLGEITSLSYNNGFAKAKVGNKTIEITFKRRALYVNGYKLHTKSRLIKNTDILECGIGMMLVYPVVINNSDKKVQYIALALWQYQFQHYISGDLFHRIVTEGNKQIYDDDNENTNSVDKICDDKVARHMTGTIVKVAEHYGIIESKSLTVDSVFVYFSRDDLYIDGMKLKGKELIYSPDKSRPCNLYGLPTEFREIRNFDGTKRYPITMEATLVWIGKKPITLKSPVTSGPLMSLPDLGGVANGACNDDDFHKAAQIVRPSSPVMEHRAGRFVFLGERYGVIQCGKLDADFILFDFSILWIDGETLGIDEGLYNSIIHDDVQCNLVAYSIPVVDVGGLSVNMQATAVWLGKKPFHIMIPFGRTPKSNEVASKQVKLDAEESDPQKEGNISKYITKSNEVTDIKDKSSEITDKLAKVNLKDSNGADTKESMEYKIDPKNPYIGKHVGARIVKLMKGKGIAKWHCAAVRGDVYIEFSRKKMFVNLCPMNDRYELGDNRSGNFFVIPTKPKEINNYTVSLVATCGWIGSKPHDIPVPGLQSCPKIPLEDLRVVEMPVGRHVDGHIVKMMKQKGIARWRSIPFGGDVFLEFDKYDCCPNITNIFDGIVDLQEETRKCHFYVIPIEHKEVTGYTISLSATCGWMSKKPNSFPKPKPSDQPELTSEMVHITPVDPAVLKKELEEREKNRIVKEKSMKSLDNVGSDAAESVAGQEKENSKKKKTNKSDVWEDEDEKKTDLEGKIIELHSNVGRLQGADGNQHFFSREHCYLYGVNLSSVELWHVLIQDETVTYRLNEISGENKISKMWVGPENIEDAEKAAAYIYEWCSKHLVPEGTRELLVHQLELSKENANAAKEKTEK